MTKHHSGWCTLCQRCSRGPSTSEGGEPAHKATNTSVAKIIKQAPAVEVMRATSQRSKLEEREAAVSYVAFPDVVGVFVYVSGQAEVTDLHNVAL